MIVIDIAKEFAILPGARNYNDGKYSGEEFFDNLLKPQYQKAVDSNVKLKVILDGTEGPPSSFINEAFRRLSLEFGADNVWNNLLLISDEVPRLAAKVKASIYEEKK